MLSVLSSPRLWILVLFVVSAAFVHLRGRVRHKFARQLTDHSSFLAPFNLPFYLMSKVHPRPFLDPKEVPDLAVLHDNWETIRDEGMRLLDEGYVRAASGFNDVGFNSFFRTGWKRFYLKWYDEPLPSASKLCPKTVELLARVPIVHAAMYALLPPGGRLVRHRDPFAGSLRYHLGLSTPDSEDCFLEVDGRRYFWRDGEDMIFDETFLHWAENKTQKTRLILFADVERPVYTGALTAVNRVVCTRLMRAAATENVPGEKIGFLNKVFGQAYKVRLVAKRVKKWNEPIYYGLHYALFASLVYLVFFL
jgi:beta-hydroxylase